MNIQQIIDAVCHAGGVYRVELLSDRRVKPLPAMRACVARLARELVTCASYPSIAKALGMSSHGSVIAMVKGEPSDGELAVINAARRKLLREAGVL